MRKTSFKFPKKLPKKCNGFKRSGVDPEFGNHCWAWTGCQSIKNVIRGSCFTCPERGVADSITALIGALHELPRAGNAGNIYVGGSNVSSANGFVLAAGEETPPLNVDNLTDVYIDADNNGEGISYIYVIP